MNTTLERCPACLSLDLRLQRPAVWAESDLVGCNTCRTEFLSPQPTDERLAEIYSEDYYEPWGVETAETVDAMKRTTFSPMLSACEPGPGRSVLDLGCATGSFLAEAATAGAVPYGIDLNPRAIAVARDRVPEAHLHIGVVADAPFPGVAFDAVVMIDFIEHVRDPEAELRVVRARTHSGSRLVISTPRVDSLVRTLARGHWPQYREEHLTYFSLAGIRALLVRTGFTIRSVRATRKAITLAYAYGQATAYPVPVLSPATSVAYRVLPPLRHRAVRVGMGEMTVVAERSTDDRR
jgi:2-polyprenyl-3-methyl-5-hydroxy-6-metoxy-1,4-benzoquinol methylase